MTNPDPNAVNQMSAELQRKALAVDLEGNEKFGKQFWSAGMEAYKRTMAGGGFSADQLQKIVETPNAADLLANGAAEILLREVQAGQDAHASKDERARGAASEHAYKLWRDSQRKKK